MTGSSSPARATGSGALREHGASGWIERLARAGLAAKGIVYLVVGLLAAQAAIGSGTATDSTGALQRIEDEWWGTALLAVIAVGLIGFAIWRFVAALFDPEGDGAAQRIFHVVSGVVHGALALQAGRMALGSGAAGSGSTNQASSRTADLMSQPFGIWIVGILGAVIAGYGVYRLYEASTARLDDRLALGRLSRDAKRWVIRIGRAGVAARGVVFGIIGWFLISAALEENPGQARGLGGALRTLQDQPYGPVLLAAVAIGLIAYGLYQMLEARYRAIRTPG